MAFVAAAVVSVALFSSFFRDARGVVDSVRAYGLYLTRMGATSWHSHPWDYYLRLLLRFPSAGTPVWTEGLVVGLAAIGLVAGWRARAVHGAERRIVRFLGVYTVVMVGVYSAIPYKTPWCLLGFLHGMILLAGVGVAAVWRASADLAIRGPMAALLAAGAVHLGWQAWAGRFRFSSDPRNPYVYAHTLEDVRLIARRVEGVAQAAPEGRATPVDIISRENLWPLPWYLRRLTATRWWNGVSDQSPSAPVVLLTPEMEPALVRKLYDLPAPGERELYMRLFDRRVELRPRVELRGYATKTLWDRFLQAEAGRLSPPAPGPQR